MLGVGVGGRFDPAWWPNTKPQNPWGLWATSAGSLGPRGLPTPSGPQEAGWSFRPGLASAHSWAPRVNQSRQCGSSLIKVQGFNRSFKNPKLLPPPAQPPGPLPPVHGSSRPAPTRPGRAKVPAYSRRTAAAERDQHSQLHLICPETGWR